MNAPIRTAEEAIEAEARAILVNTLPNNTLTRRAIERNKKYGSVSVHQAIRAVSAALATRITQPDRETIARALSVSRYGHAIDDERHVSDGERLSLYRDADAVLAAIGSDV